MFIRPWILVLHGLLPASHKLPAAKARTI
jgi:hypothetical protein